MSASDPS